MKTLTDKNFLISVYKPLRKCESTFMLLASQSLSVWRRLRGLVRKHLLSPLKEAALLKALTIPDVRGLLSLNLNKRHIVGITLWMVGISCLFIHLLFDPYSMEHQVCRVLGFDPANCWNGKGGSESTGWCYTSWFDYFVQIRFFVALLFWSVALPLLVPVKKSLCIFIASTFFAIGTGWILHYSFFSTSYQTINAFPEWRLFAIGLALGASVVMSTDYLVHAYNHRVIAFEKRLLTLYNGADLVDDKKFKILFKQYVEEKQAFQKTILMPEFLSLTCSICGHDIDPKSWYSCYEIGRYYAHSECFQRARKVNHNVKLVPSKIKLVSHEDH